MSRKVYSIERDEKGWEPEAVQAAPKPAWVRDAELRYNRVQNLKRARDIKNGIIPRPVKPVETPAMIEQKIKQQVEKQMVSYDKRINALKKARRIKAIRNGPSKKSKKTKPYDITYRVSYKLVNDGKRWVTSTVAVKRNLTKPELTPELKTELRQYAYESIRTKDSGVSINRDTIVIKSFSAVEIKKHNIRETSVGNLVMNYERFSVYDEISDRQCWYNFLIENGISDAKITEHFNMKRTHVLVSELFYFIKKCNRSVYLIDLCNNVFSKHVVDRADGAVNNHEAAIYGLIANQHVYNINDKELRSSITKRGIVNKVRNVITSNNKYKTKEDKRIHNDLPNNVDLSLINNDCIYYNNNNNDDGEENPLMKWMYEIIRVHKIIPKKIKYVGHSIVSMTWKNITFWHNKHSKNCVAICKILNIKYRNQSIQTLSKFVMEKLKIDRAGLLSRYNDDVRKVFNSELENCNLKCGGLNVRPNTAKCEDRRWEAYDIRKCYSYVASTYKLPVITIWDEIVKYSGKIQKAAFYYVEKTNMLMQSYGWYIGHLVDYCIDCDMITKDDIKYMIVPSFQSNELRKLVSGVHSLGLGEFAKNIVNISIGALATKDSKTIQSIFTTSVDEANYYRCMFNSKIIASPIGEAHLYRIDNKINSICAESGKPAYVAIVQIGYMLVHKLYMAILEQDKDAKLLSIHVDSVCVERSNDKTLSITNCLTKQRSQDNIGFIRKEETVPNSFNKLEHKAFNMEYSYVVKDYSKWNTEQIKQWDEACAIELYKKYSNGALVLGAAGTGKSEMLKIWKKHLITVGYEEKEIMTVGFTNSSMNGNIQGRTLHNLFGIGIDKSNEDTSVEVKKHLIDNIKICLVDEISMIPGYMYSYLLLLKQIGVKLFIFGDFRQIPPIEAVKRDYENSIVLKQLTNCNKIVLTHNYRSDTKYVQVCDSGNFDFDYFKRNNDMDATLDKFNIARYNDVCKNINEDCAKIYGAKGESGSRLILNCNIRKLGVFKNQFYEIINKESKTIKQLFVDNAVERVVDDMDMLLSKSSLGYCVTVEKSQGLTIKENYTMYNFEAYDDCHRYVALTRTSNCNSVRIDSHKTGIIYKICKKKAKFTDPIYIGSTACGLEKRFQQHLKETTKSKLNTYLANNDCEAIRVCFVIYKDKTQLLQLEDKFIKQFNTVDKGLNSRVNF